MDSLSNLPALFRKLKCCVLLPTYNNAQTLHAVITEVLKYTGDVIVVNDGSTDSTLQIISAFPQVNLLSYERNQGKGTALRRGFKHALNAGYDYVITLDTDGQHYPEDLPAMLSALEQNRNAIIIGARNMNQANVPGKSSFGNKFSNFWFKLETGVEVPDTQSGYRVYPVASMSNIRFFTWKYEFEIEVLVRSSWAGIDVISVPVKVYYPPAEERITHFRPFQDFSRISVLNTVLVFITFVWIKPRNFFRLLKKKSLKQFFADHILREQDPPAVKAWSVAIGVFWGISPLWGFQMWIVLLFAFVFKLNKAIAVLASNVSIPPFIPFIIFFSFQAGKIWFPYSAIDVGYSNALSQASIQRGLLQYIAGSFTLAAFMGIISWILTYRYSQNKLSNNRL
jgi:glycosyltransferase involved in cell wall biosynthesis